jgi:hypothetical protein
MFSLATESKLKKYIEENKNEPKIMQKKSFFR